MATADIYTCSGTVAGIELYAEATLYGGSIRVYFRGPSATLNIDNHAPNDTPSEYTSDISIPGTHRSVAEARVLVKEVERLAALAEQLLVAAEIGGPLCLFDCVKEMV